MRRKSRILVVDDDEFALVSMARVLESERIQVVTAAGGSEAIELLERESFDLILTDLKMPDVDGFEVLRQARKIAPHAVVLVLTGYATLESKREAMRKGVYDTLVKPCDGDELRLRVEKGLERVHLEKERQRAERAWRESEGRLSQIIQGSPVPAFVIDRDHTIVHWNRACENLTSIPANDMMGTQGQWRAFYPEERPVMADLIVDGAPEQEIARVYAGKYRQSAVIEGAYEAEDFFPHLGERGKWLFFTAAPLRDREGKLVGAIETLQDITERRQAEEALRRAHDELEQRVQERTADLVKTNEALQTEITRRRQAQETLLIQDKAMAACINAIDIVDLEEGKWNVIYVNPALLQMWGYESEEDILGKPAVHLWQDMEEVADVVKRVYDQGRWSGELVAVRKDGSTFDAQIAASVVRDETGEPICLMGSFVDITARKQMEEALRESEERYRSLFDGIPTGLYRNTPDGQCLDANPAALEMAGYPDRESLQEIKSANLYVDPEDRKRWQALMEREGIVRGFEVPFRRRDGTIFWALDSARAAHDADGRVLFYEGSLQDITERKRAEEALQKRTAQLEALRQVGLEITAELNLDTLLRSIVSRAVDLLRGDSGGIDLYRPEQDLMEWTASMGIEPLPGKAITRRGEGLSGKILESGEPLIVDDYQHWEGRAAAWDGYLFKSVVGVPVRWGGEFLGVLEVLANPPRTFSPADADLLSLFANQAAIAIENAHLYEAEQERRHIAETLRQASTVLSSTLELDEVLGLILQQLRQVVPCDSASVQRLQGEHLELVACQGFEEPDQVVGLVYPLEPRFPNYRVVTTRTPFAIEDTTREYPFFQDEADRYQSGHIRSWLGVPLLVKEQVIGMITLDRVEVRPYTAEEVQLAMAFANQAAIAIENARLFEELEERRVYLEGVLGAAPDAIVTLDAQARVVEWNAGAERLFGTSREEALGQDIDHLVTRPDILEEAIRLGQITMSGKEVPPTETVRYRKDGSPVDVLLAASPILVGGELIGVVVVYTDITARVRMEEALRAMALVDDLTGLYNRRGFFNLAEQQLKMAHRAKRKLLLLFADFDGLKRINDALGHPEGDRALVEVAEVLRETFRESDIVARIGGDEFVVLAVETNRADPEALITRLQETLEARNAGEGRRYRLALSVGVAHYDPERPCSMDELLARADRAMYEQKREEQ